jgi:hypothetical protein
MTHQVRMAPEGAIGIRSKTIQEMDHLEAETDKKLVQRINALEESAEKTRLLFGRVIFWEIKPQFGPFRPNDIIYPEEEKVAARQWEERELCALEAYLKEHAQAVCARRFQDTLCPGKELVIAQEASRAVKAIMRVFQVGKMIDPSKFKWQLIEQYKQSPGRILEGLSHLPGVHVPEMIIRRVKNQGQSLHVIRVQDYLTHLNQRVSELAIDAILSIADGAWGAVDRCIALMEEEIKREAAQKSDEARIALLAEYDAEVKKRNTKALAIVEPRDLSRGPKSKFLADSSGYLGIQERAAVERPRPTPVHIDPHFADRRGVCEVFSPKNCKSSPKNERIEHLVSKTRNLEFSVHPRVHRWQEVRHLHEIKQFSDHRQNGEIRHLYVDMNEEQLLGQLRQHHFPHLDKLLASQWFRDAYCKRVQTSWVLKVQLIDGKGKHFPWTVMTASTDTTGRLYHAFAHPVSELLEKGCFLGEIVGGIEEIIEDGEVWVAKGSHNGALPITELTHPHDKNLCLIQLHCHHAHIRKVNGSILFAPILQQPSHAEQKGVDE